jgi:hypothetical protein
MIWCSQNAHGMVQEKCGDAMLSTFSELSKNALYQQMTVEGSLNSKSTRFRMREIKIGFRKDKPTSA